MDAGRDEAPAPKEFLDAWRCEAGDELLFLEGCLLDIEAPLGFNDGMAFLDASEASRLEFGALLPGPTGTTGTGTAASGSTITSTWSTLSFAGSAVASTTAEGLAWASSSSSGSSVGVSFLDPSRLACSTNSGSSTVIKDCNSGGAAELMEAVRDSGLASDTAVPLRSTEATVWCKSSVVAPSSDRGEGGCRASVGFSTSGKVSGKS